MKEMQGKKIKVHKSLHDLFGRETTLTDLFAVFLGSVSLTFLTLTFIWEVDLTFAKKVVLTLLALDIGGGVVANFTEGTNNLYAESSKRRNLFVLIHVLQPMLLAWIYKSNVIAIFIITGFALISTFCVINIKENNIQRVIAATLLLIGILLIQLLNFSDQLLQVILIVYSVKLILSFAVNWTSLKQQAKE
jgi:hypothetical protein